MTGARIFDIARESLTSIKENPNVSLFGFCYESSAHAADVHEVDPAALLLSPSS